MFGIRRREFIRCSAARRRRGRWRRARSRPDRMRRIGVLMNTGPDDPEGQARIVAFVQALQRIGLDRRPQCADRLPLGAGDADHIRKYAAELVALAPDVILAVWQRDRGAVASGDPHRADRVRAGPRSGRRWLRR